MPYVAEEAEVRVNHDSPLSVGAQSEPSLLYRVRIRVEG
jgi:hypothetical protein